jgi:hypothetical protein
VAKVLVFCRWLGDVHVRGRGFGWLFACAAVVFLYAWGVGLFLIFLPARRLSVCVPAVVPFLELLVVY